ncbi:gentisate 1,2-dioxygenase [Rhodosalinus halophilus]|uniref:Gentisate 1,2-dioxygenase n=1 Tax=Rhodosalinus halophilus TaxID=2259333 RepID=A0A365UDS1_9RHOB|nr:gentisate 1,2-dioxygenase [Rhodosalinus halophilus]RBI87522.1 gentisate 1,2-dioxygenase [Rhodosalinus halophilus]
MEKAPEETPERRAFYDRIDKKNMTPLWSVLGDLVTPEPRSPARPYGWRFDDIRAAMIEAGGLITAKEAERRVLILENPGLRGQSKTTTCLYAGVQLVLPGEVAPAHRHTQSALRFVLEGSGAHTAVGGEKTVMRPGDFVITPPMAWHDHGNETDAPMFWLDGLDIPLVNHLDVSFAEMLGEDAQDITREPGQSYAEYGHNLMPVDAPRGGMISPIFNYPYEEARETLETMKRSHPFDPCHGWKLRYTNPLDGGWAMTTIGTCIQLLPRGTTAPYRSTDGTVFTVVEGKGRTRVGEEVIEWGPKDIFVAPSWWPVVHEVDAEAVIFSFSDRPVQEKLGFFRERRGNA